MYISDPAAKTKRTDTSNATLFVGGLSSETKQEDVEELLRPVSPTSDDAKPQHGAIRNVKLGWDPMNRVCRGFAFVDMTSEVSNCASLISLCRRRMPKPV